MLEQKPAPNITASITSNSSTLRESNKLRLGIIGLGKMGGNLALQAMEIEAQDRISKEMV